MAEGEFHEAMNLAALWEVPVLFCCENNGYAMGTSLETSESETNLTAKAASYEMPAWRVDGMDVEACREATDRALTSIRAGGGPVFCEFVTYRFRAHSMFDPELYREKEEVEAWRARDPIQVFGRQLLDAGTIDEAGIDGLWAGARSEIEAAVAFAEASPEEPIETLTRHVYRREVTP